MKRFDYHVVFMLISFSILKICMSEKPKRVLNNIKAKEIPPIIGFSIFMGDLTTHYDYTELTIESMRRNPKVDFVLINITPMPGQDSALKEINSRLKVPNFHHHVISLKQLHDRVLEKLSIDVNFTKDWYDKMPDYKPLLGYLFSEFIRPDHKYWGYIDMDVIWGNFNSYADWFQGDYSFIFPTHHIPGGYMTFLINKPWSLKLFMEDDPVALKLLQNLSHHCLDEDGKNPRFFDGKYYAEQSMFVKISDYEIAHKEAKILRVPYIFQPFTDYAKTVWGHWGPVRWFQGSLNIVHGSLDTAPERDLIFFHRAERNSFSAYPSKIRSRVIKDMITYGYLLPHFIPLHTRFLCHDVVEVKNISHYMPYRADCFGKRNNAHLLNN